MNILAFVLIVVINYLPSMIRWTQPEKMTNQNKNTKTNNTRHHPAKKTKKKRLEIFIVFGVVQGLACGSGVARGPTYKKKRKEGSLESLSK